jgi:ABC-2 type transport system permease protein
MTFALIRKLLRDVRLPLVVVALLLTAFQCLWAKITERIVGQIVPFFSGLAMAQKLAPDAVESLLFKGPGQLTRTLMGGETIKLDSAMDMLTIGYVHPLMQVLFCIWAIGRSAGAIAGEIDRGTMELLLAQPLPRWRLLLAHFCVDVLTIPVLCLSLWAGSALGVWLVGPITIDQEAMKTFRLPFGALPAPDSGRLYIDAAAMGPGLWNVAALIFAIGGYTMWLSARGRFRWQVMGAAVLITLLQFLANVVGQLWDVGAPLRPLTVFYYYQPQQIILSGRWTVDLGTVWNGGEPLVAVNVLVVLFTVGAVGYGMALWTFCWRDLPAPL